MMFQVMDLCARCHMIGIDQQTGTHMPEPLKSLSACRKGKVSTGGVQSESEGPQIKGIFAIGSVYIMYI